MSQLLGYIAMPSGTFFGQPPAKRSRLSLPQPFRGQRAERSGGETRGNFRPRGRGTGGPPRTPSRQRPGRGGAAGRGRGKK